MNQVRDRAKAGAFEVLVTRELDRLSRDLLDSGRDRWLGGYALAHVLLASYEHHREHLDKALEWQRRASEAEG